MNVYAHTLLCAFFYPGAGYLAVCISFKTSSIAVLTLHSAIFCSSTATQDVLVLGELL